MLISKLYKASISVFLVFALVLLPTLPIARAYDADALPPSYIVELEELIAAATELKDAATVGAQLGEYPQETLDALVEAIEAAQAVFDDPETTQKQVETAIADLVAAIDVFLAAVVAGPPAVTEIPAEPEPPTEPEPPAEAEIPMAPAPPIETAPPAETEPPATVDLPAEPEPLTAVEPLTEPEPAATLADAISFDVNGDGAITAADLALVLYYLNVEFSEITDGINPDVNGDGVVDLADVAALVNALYA
jgi:hypothetical protein